METGKTTCEHAEPHERMCANCIGDLLDKIDRLQAIVDKLPKTADGVPITPGMTVWTKYWTGPRKELVDDLQVFVAEPTIWMNGEADTDQLYSTEAAAREAAGG